MQISEAIATKVLHGMHVHMVGKREYGHKNGCVPALESCDLNRNDPLSFIKFHVKHQKH